MNEIKEISEMEEIVNFENLIHNYCRMYSKEKGDCFNCPIGKRISEYCKVDGVIRFLEKVIRNENEKSKNPNKS